MKGIKYELLQSCSQIQRALNTSDNTAYFYITILFIFKVYNTKSGNRLLPYNENSRSRLSVKHPCLHPIPPLRD